MLRHHRRRHPDGVHQIGDAAVVRAVDASLLLRRTRGGTEEQVKRARQPTMRMGSTHAPLRHTLERPVLVLPDEIT